MNEFCNLSLTTSYAVSELINTMSLSFSVLKILFFLNVGGAGFLINLKQFQMKKFPLRSY